MTDGKLESADGIAGRHLSARQMAERAMQAEAEGDQDKADELFAEANRVDPGVVIAALQQNTSAGGDTSPQNDEEIAAMSRTIEPGDAPSRSGISGSGTISDNQGT